MQSIWVNYHVVKGARDDALHISTIFVKTKMTMAGWLKKKSQIIWKNR